MTRFIFTVTAGRSGQATLTRSINASCTDCIACFEEPAVRPRLPGLAGDLERRFRRRFVETHELLGRGKVLKAQIAGDLTALDSFARQRIAYMEAEAKTAGVSTYFDISKYFARGLHVGLERQLEQFDLVLLIRNPVLNMRSFLNRAKNFYLDNVAPDSPNNCLIMSNAGLSNGELYLWAWSEMALRYFRLCESPKVRRHAILRTSDLERPEIIDGLLDRLDLPHGELELFQPLNTNTERGLPQTEPSDDDYRVFFGFLDKVRNAHGAILDDVPFVAEIDAEKRSLVQ